MKKLLIIILSICVAFAFAACGGQGGTQPASEGQDITDAAEEIRTGGQSDLQNNTADDNISVIATIFPAFDWTGEILGDNPGGVSLDLLLDSGVDLHNYQPSAEDILEISNCDVFIYVGGESDEWVDDALEQAINKNMIVVNLLDVLGEDAKEEEIVEGMQEADEHEHVEGAAENEPQDAAEESEHEDGGADDHDHGEEAEYDEHVWLSLKNAQTLCNAIANALSEADPANVETYQKNTAAYIEKLDALDKQYSQTAEAAAIHTLLFGDRFPFRYLTDDYGLDYYAAFVGCSAETEASFETISFLSQKVDELGLKCVMTIEGADHRIAETVVQNTKSKDQQILTMDSMQSVTKNDIDSGTTYLGLMEKNLDVLKEALK